MTQAALHHKRDFEELNNQLRLGIHHAVFGETPDMRWSNCISFCRLFFIHQIAAGSRSGGSIRLCAQPDADALDLQAGVLYFLPANQEIEGIFHPGLSIIAFHIGLEAFAGSDVFAGHTGFRQRQDQVAVIDELAAMTSRPFGLAEMIRVRGLVHASAALFVEHSIEDLRHLISMRGRYRAIFAVLETQPLAQVTVQGLARLMGVKREQLSRCFAKDMGIPLKSYLIRHLTAKVCERLAMTTGPVKDVAEEFGFSREGYFNRFISRQTGKSPLQYRCMRQRWDAAP